MHRSCIYLALSVLSLVVTLSGGLRVRAAGMPAPRSPAGLALQLAPTSFAPATIRPASSGVEDGKRADTRYFKRFHSKSYESLGLQSAYYQAAAWEPAAGDPVKYFYQGNVFGSAIQAFTAWHDANLVIQRLTGGQQATRCPNLAGITCTWQTYRVQKNVYYFGNLQAGNCTAEVGTVSTTANRKVESLLQELTTIQRQIFDAASDALTSACNPNSPQNVSFLIRRTAVLSSVRNLDTRKAVKFAIRGKTYYLAVYLTVKVAPSEIPAKIVFSIAGPQSGRLTVAPMLRTTLPGPFGGGSLPENAVPAFPYVFPRQGAYTITASVSIGSKRKTAVTGVIVR